MGNVGNLGLMGAEITEFSSEQNKISSTLFKFSSEIKKFSSELFAFISEVKIHISKNPAKNPQYNDSEYGRNNPLHGNILTFRQLCATFFGCLQIKFVPLNHKTHFTL